MKTLKFFTIAAFVVILIAGCKSTGMKAFSKGDYFTACLQAVEKLRSSPDNGKAMEALSKAYPMAVNFTEKEVERLNVSTSNNNRYQQMFELYGSMNNIAVQISRCPAALRIIPNADYYNSQLESSRSMAAEECYKLAEARLRTGNRLDAKQAYTQFLRVNTIIPGYKDVNEKIQEAKWMATLKVVLEQVPVEGSYKLSADFFQNKVFEYFSKNIRNEYIYIFSPQEAMSGNLYPDQIIRLRFLDFVVGQSRENNNTTEIKRDSVITGTYTDNKGVTHSVYGTVKAKLTTRNVEISSSGVLDAFIIDYRTNTILSQQRFPGTFVWKDSYASFNGDERALSQKEIALCKRTSFATPPPPQDMFIEFTVPIYTSLTKFIQNYYRNY